MCERWGTLEEAVAVAGVAIGTGICIWGWPTISFDPASPKVTDWLAGIGSSAAAIGAVWIAYWNEKNRRKEAKTNGAIEIESSETTLDHVVDSLQTWMDRTSFDANSVRGLQGSAELARSRLDTIEEQFPPPPEDHDRALREFEEAIRQRDQAMDAYLKRGDELASLRGLLDSVRYPVAQGFDHHFSRQIVAARNHIAQTERAVQQGVLRGDDAWRMPADVALTSLESARTKISEATTYLSKI